MDGISKVEYDRRKMEVADVIGKLYVVSAQLHQIDSSEVLFIDAVINKLQREWFPEQVAKENPWLREAGV